MNVWPAIAQRGIPLVESAVKAIAIFVAFWIGAKIVELVICKFRARDGAEDLILVLGRSAKITLLVFGLITALGTVGVNVEALVAGLGLTGFALGFAFRDILSNLLAGVLILLYRPFQRGHYISTSGLDGTVLHIDLRYTMLEQDGKTILIPNSNLFTNPIVVTKKEPAAQTHLPEHEQTPVLTR